MRHRSHLFLLQHHVMAAVLVLCAVLPGWYEAEAQPVLSFKRVTVNWPTMELHIAYGCDGFQRYDAEKRNFRIFENGEEITDFTFWCPPPMGWRVPASLALVMDVSGSMRGRAMTVAKQSAQAIVDLCDGRNDELMLLEAGAQALVSVPFTSNKAQLHAPIASCSPGGPTALYDGIYAGLQEMVAGGVNPSRAVLVFTDGGDNGSVRTVQELIALANRNRIRIYTIGYDDYGPKPEMELIAQLTGGKYYKDPNAGQMAGIYQEITSGMIGLQECLLTYDRDCADGTLRTVEVQLVDFCEGSDYKTKTYRAPLDSTSFRPISVEIPKTLLPGLQSVSIPIMLDGPDALLQPFELTLHYDSTVLLTGTDVQPEALLHGVAHQIDQQPGRLIVRSTEPLRLNGRATLLEVGFRAARAADSLHTGVAIESMAIPTGCLLPRITNHPVVIVPRLLPFITAKKTIFCAGDSVTLEANAGFARYYWSNGETTRMIRVGEGGNYGLIVVDANGDSLHAPPVTITRMDPPRVRIVADGQLEFCRGKSVRLICSGDIDGATIRWSDGREGVWQFFSSPGMYWADITSAAGCTARSDTVYTIVTEFTTRVLPGQDIQLCPGDSVTLSVEGKWSNVNWWGENRETLTVGWKENGSFSLRAEVTDNSGCKGFSDSVRITMLPEFSPQITPSGTIELCLGGSLTLSAEAGYTEYHWSTGERAQSINVNQAGDYSARVVNHNGCSARTDTVHVVSVDAPRPRITMMREPVYCGGTEIELDGGANYVSWKWNTGATTRTLAVADSGSYWVEVTAYGGCTGLSDTVIVRSEELLDDFLPTVRGSLPLCPGDTLWLDGPEGMRDWLWNTGHHSRSLPVTKAGRYAVTVLTEGGCEARSGYVDVSVTASTAPVIARVRDVLSTADARSWQWKLNGMPIPGATQQSLTLRSIGSYTVTVVDSNGCTMTSAPFNVNILGISETGIPDDLLLYPEPASDWLHVVFPGPSRDARVTLVSLLGQVLARRETQGPGDNRTMRIDLSDLPAGIYLLQANSGERWWVRKVVKR
ncbi:MAG: VWA domain-containing protein [Bacteroidia bacterium]|nr:VWA domain-containing protein [Bacteroidia bacterium]